MALSQPPPAWVDPLEPRRLMDAALFGNILVVLGSSASDDIRVYRAPGPTDAPVYQVEIGPRYGDGPTRMWQFPAGKVASVVVRAGGGDDIVDLGAMTFPLPRMLGYGPTDVPARVDAGLGDDAVYGGTTRDFLLGSFGKDRAEGGRGDDWIDGGWNDDVLRGGEGNDLIFGSYGNDAVGGDEGNDRLFGGPGDDFLGSLGFGPRPTEPGDDLLVGGTGEDRLVGGEGKDLLFGGPGRDHFSRADDESEMVDRTPDEPIDIVLPL